MTKAAIYVRVSSGSQVEGFSLEAQTEACRALAGQRDWNVIAVYREEGVSAKTTDRPAFQRMMDDALSRRFEIIIVHKLDRFSRSVVDLLLTLRDLDKHRISLISVTEQFDFTTTVGRVMLTMLAALAEWFLGNLSQETMKGQRERAEQGLWSNRLPFGYTTADGLWKKDGGVGLAIPDEETRQGYDLACRLAETGEYSYRRIAIALNDAGYRPSGRAGKRSLTLWSTDSVRYMLQNRFYLGEVSYHGEWFSGVHEPLTTPERFEHIQKIMRARQRVPAWSAKSNTRFYLLSGLVRCATCGSPARGEYKVDKYKERVTEYRYYRCASSYRAVSCDALPYINAEEVEGEVERFLTGFAFAPEWRKRIQEVADGLQVAGKAPDSTKSLKRLRTEMDRLKDMYRLGHIERDEYLSQYNRLQADLDAIPTVETPRKVTKMTELLLNLGAVWQVATPEERKKLVRDIVERVELHPDSIRIIVKPSYAPFFPDTNQS